MLLLLCIFWAIGAGTPVLAQTDDLTWSTPENLSHSGVASSQAIVVAPNGTLRVIWWDEFDGLMVADGTVSSQGESDITLDWSAPASAPIMLPQEVVVDGEIRLISLPIEIMPRILADKTGRAQAFWLGEPDRLTGKRALLHSSLPPEGTVWTSPRPLSESASSFDATVDESGALHLVYVRPEQAVGLASGLYYERSRDAGNSWSSPKLVSDSLYLRLLSDEDDLLRLTADSRDSVYVTWVDPRTGQILVGHTSDGGTTWQEPRPYAVSDGSPLLTRVIAVPDRPDLLIWKPVDDQAKMVGVSGEGNTLTLTYWQDDHWATPTQLTLRLEDPELGEPLSLSGLEFALIPAGPEQDGAVENLVLTGLDQKGDIWAAGIPMDIMERLATQSADTSTSGPANLSKGGASSSPVIVAGPNDSVYAFWFDQYQGLMAADGIVSTSLVVSGTEEIMTSHEIWSPARPVPLPAWPTPQILAGVDGTLHAFWLGDQETTPATTEPPGTQPLMYSQLEPSGSAWSQSTVLAEAATGFDVVVDSSGALHLAYAQALEMPHSSAGIYHRRAEPDGSAWKAPVAVQLSRYLRALSPENTHLDMAVEQTGGVYVTWDDPHQERAQLAFSPDGGERWNAPVPVGVPERQALRGRLVTVLDDQTLLLWETGQEGGICILHQTPAEHILHDPKRVGQRVLEDLLTCPQNERIFPLDDELTLLVAGSGSETLMLAVWDGQRWSESRQLSFGFDDPDSAGNVYLTDLGFDLVALPAGSGGEPGGKALMVVGIDRNEDVWATSSQMGDLEVVFAPPAPWSQPISFSASQNMPDVPAVATDETGQVHVLWSEPATPGEPGAELLYARGDPSLKSGQGKAPWTQPVPVLESATGGAEKPALIVLDSRLHAVWSGGEGGETFYSWAFGRDAHSSGGWSKPVQLPAPIQMGSNPVIARGADDVLHVIFAIPVNEQRGIYHTRSEDGGESWSPAHRVFGAAETGWVMADYPRLSVDGQGALHAIWVRFALPGGRSPEGIYHARSTDGGETWSEPVDVRTGPSIWPQVAASGDGRLHVVWTEMSEPPTWWHQWSEDGGQNWTLPEPVPRFSHVAPPAGLVPDGGEGLYLTGIGYDDTENPAILFSTWDGQRWWTEQPYRLDLEVAGSGVSVGRATSLQRLDVVFRGQAEPGEGTRPIQLWHDWRQISLVDATPAAISQPSTEELTPEGTLAPHSTLPAASTPAAGTLPTTESTATPDFSIKPASDLQSSSSLPIPLLVAGGLATTIVVAGLAMGLMRSRRR